MEPAKYEVVKPKPIEYKFVAVKYGEDKLRKLTIEKSPTELTDLHHMLKEYIKAGWRIKQFFIHQTDVFVVLLEK
jgi:hypothetical protein